MPFRQNFYFRLALTVIIPLCVAWSFTKIVQSSFFDIARVTNESMLPFLKQGDLLVIDKAAPCLKIPFTQQKFFCRSCEIGHAYVFQNPLDARRYLVKFAVAKAHQTSDIIWFTQQSINKAASFDAKTSCFFEGSNTEHSIDSRHFGPIQLQEIVGKVVYPPIAYNP